MKRCWKLIIICLIGFILSLTLGNSVSSQIKEIGLVQEAQQHYQQGEFEFSLKLLKQANREFANSNKTLQQAQTQSLISLNQQQLGNWEQAQRAINYSLALIATKPETKSKQQVLGQIWNAQGHLNLRKGKPEKALGNWSKAEYFYQNINDKLGVKGITIARAQALDELGFYRRSCNIVIRVFTSDNLTCQQLKNEQLTSILKATKESNTLLIEGLSSLANNLMLLGKLNSAQQVIEHSQSLLNRVKQSSLLNNKINFSAANIAQAIANLAQEREDTAQFNQENQKAIALYQQIIQATNPEQLTDIIEARINLLNIYIKEKKWDLASKIVNQYNLTPAEIPLSYRTLKTQLILASSLTSLKENNVSIPQTCDDIAQLYLQISQQAHNLENYRLESSALGNLGQLAFQQQLHLNIDPQSQIEQALQIAQTNQAPEIAYRWQWQLGKIYRHRGNIDKAIIAYQAAFNTLQELRSDLIALDREIQYSFRQQVEPVYREYTELLLVAQTPDKITADNLKKARDVIEALQIAELDNYFKDACLTSQQRNIEEIDSQAAVIYTIILPGEPKKTADRLEVILSLPNGNFYHHQTIIAHSELPNTIKTLNNYLLQPDRLNDINRLAHQVYDWLIEPIETVITSSSSEIKTLVFVLDGVLQNLPMSALYDGNQYLLEKYAIAITPGLRLLNAQPSSAKLTALAAGVSEQRADFAALKNVLTEINTINSTLNSQTLLNSQFTSQNFAQTINSQPFYIIHLATHGQFSSNLDRTFILLWDRRLSIEDLSYLLQNRNQDSSQIIDLLVLSACETAKGDNRATLGLAGMAIRTGVSSTLATLWQVSDRSTAVVMEHFYQYLTENPTISKAEALRLAQLDLWQVTQQDWQVPLFWAPYVIVGNWL